MPLELLRESPKVRAAFWKDQVLALAVHRLKDIYLHQLMSLLPEYICRIKTLFG